MNENENSRGNLGCGVIVVLIAFVHTLNTRGDLISALVASLLAFCVLLITRTVLRAISITLIAFSQWLQER